MTPSPYRPEINSQADLENVWCHLMGGGGFSRSTLWMMFIEYGHPIPQLVEITDADIPPQGKEVTNFTRLIRKVSSDGKDQLSFAFLRSRPGSQRLSALDRDWAAAIYQACRDAGVSHEVFHVATAGQVTPVPADELAA